MAVAGQQTLSAAQATATLRKVGIGTPVPTLAPCAPGRSGMVRSAAGTVRYGGCGTGVRPMTVAPAPGTECHAISPPSAPMRSAMSSASSM